jgi:Tol biopolymer transport system component
VKGWIAAGVFSCVLVAAAGSAASSPTAPRPRFSGLIAYWSDEPFPSIWKLRSGSRPARILRGSKNAKRPRISPDRRWVAFDGAPPGKPAMSDFDVQVVRLDGTARRTLTRSSAWDVDAQWSPDGKRLAFTRLPPHPSGPEGASVWIVGLDGTGLRRLVDGADARWSPDGGMLVYDAPSRGRPGDLFVMNADGTSAHLLLSTLNLKVAAGWSRDGERILFTSYSAANPRHTTIFVVNADGTGVRRLGRGIAATWSPDGTKILYTTAEFSPLYVMNGDGTRTHVLARVAAADPSWR